MRIQMPLALLAASFFAAACTVSFPTTDQGAPVDPGSDPVDVSLDEIVTTDADVTGVDVTGVDVTGTDVTGVDVQITDPGLDIHVDKDDGVSDLGPKDHGGPDLTVVDVTTDTGCAPTVSGGNACNKNCECVSGVCDNKVCVCIQDLLANDPCAEGCRCISGKCEGTPSKCICSKTDAKFGAPCAENCECKSGTCTNSNCTCPARPSGGNSCDDDCQCTSAGKTCENGSCACPAAASTLDGGESCNNDCQCKSKVCTGGTCLCSVVAPVVPCKTGLWCNDNTGSGGTKLCMPTGQANGSPCREQDHCLTRLCVGQPKGPTDSSGVCTKCVSGDHQCSNNYGQSCTNDKCQ